MFKLSNQCTAMLGFSHDESYSLAAIVNRLPTGYEIPKDITEDFKGIFVVTRKIDYRGYCMERPVLVFEHENLMKEVLQNVGKCLTT